MTKRSTHTLLLTAAALAAVVAAPRTSLALWPWTSSTVTTWRVPTVGVATVGNGCHTCAATVVSHVAMRPSYTPLFPGWRWGLFGRWHVPTATTVTAARPVTTTYAPSACTTCGVDPCACQSACRPVCQQVCRPVCRRVCRYQAQTCYRTEYSYQATTVMRPHCVCDPCTGCTTTVMRPVVTYRPVARQVPYTTYRPVMTTVCDSSACTTACSPCGTCATGSCGTALAGGSCATCAPAITSGTALGATSGMATGAARQPIRIEQHKPQVDATQGQPTQPAETPSSGSATQGTGTTGYRQSGRSTSQPSEPPQLRGAQDRVAAAATSRPTRRGIASTAAWTAPPKRTRPRDDVWRAMRPAK